MPKRWISLCLIIMALACTKKEGATVGDLSKYSGAVIETKFGKIELKFLSDVAPKTVENFKKLASSGFYNGSTFHRVIPGFMIQGGDPNSKDSDRSNDGQGGPGYTIPAEFSSERHGRGVISMARKPGDNNSAGSQFFIMVADGPTQMGGAWKQLDGQYTVFAKVTSGMEVADQIVSQSRDDRDNPIDRMEISIALK